MTSVIPIAQTRAELLTVNELRRLVSWCDNQHEDWWLPVGEPTTMAAVLACYHACVKAGYFSLDGWHSEDHEAAREAWLVARGSAPQSIRELAAREEIDPDHIMLAFKGERPLDGIKILKTHAEVTLNEALRILAAANRLTNNWPSWSPS